MNIHSIPTAEAGATLTIDLDAIVANWRDLAARVRGRCAAVVKADAYGTGLEVTGRALAKAGADTFFVAQIEEGIRLRAVLPGEAIYVLNGLPPGTESTFATHRLKPVLGSMEEVRQWAAFNADRSSPRPSALHVDTGMNRLGLSMEEAEALAADPALLNAIGARLLMSHMACADEPGHPLNAIQILRFTAVRSMFPHLPASIANSASILRLGREADCNLVRPGIALYGGEALCGQPSPMRPVVRLDARIIQIREGHAGETVGYGATWRLMRPSRLAVVGVGYADGIHRIASTRDGVPGFQGLAAGQRVPLLGRVNMDLMTFDITDLPDGAIKRGDDITLIGGGIPLDETARWFSTNAYEVLTSLGRRYARSYVGG